MSELRDLGAISFRGAGLISEEKKHNNITEKRTTLGCISLGIYPVGALKIRKDHVAKVRRFQVQGS